MKERQNKKAVSGGLLFYFGCIQATGLVWHHALACMELPKAHGITEGVFSCGLIPYNALH